ncbi:MAG: hypothetical protein KatS3mg114_0007 [Planctomycetaceae bacterium]|nr:MAG: hypothetical protein KatS3mg114_0007 [Planctomycetaceae bacterium]
MNACANYAQPAEITWGELSRRWCLVVIGLLWEWVWCSPLFGEEPTATLRLLHRLPPRSEPVTAATWIDDQAFILGLPGRLEVWQLQSAESPQVLTLEQPVRALAVDPRRQWLAVGQYQQVAVLSWPEGKPVQLLTGPRGFVRTVRFAPSGDALAAGSDDGAVYIWACPSGQRTLSLKHDDPVQALAWSADGRRLATAIGDEWRPTRAGTICVWNIDGSLAQRWTHHRRAALCVAWGRQPQQLFSGGLDEQIFLWQLGEAEPQANWSEHHRPVLALAPLPDGQHVLSLGGGRATGGNKLLLWSVQPLKLLAEQEAHEARPLVLALAPDGRHAVTTDQQRQVFVWAIERQQTTARPQPTPAALIAVPHPSSARPSSFAAAMMAQDSASNTPSQSQNLQTIRVGVIGLDTSHAPAFAKLMNDASEPSLQGCRVVAAYPPGSPDIPSSVNRVPMYIAEYRKLGITIVESIPELLAQVDAVLLETNDGRPHLQQALPVIKARKPCFIDKPVAGSLTDAILIYRLANHYQTPVFSSSSLRYVPSALAARAGNMGRVLGCETFSPASLEPSHPDLFWYGIHGVELLFTVMGTGCEQVTRVHTANSDLVVGRWQDGRVGTFRGIREGKAGYGGRVFTEREISDLGQYAGYKPLVAEIVQFFKSGRPPVSEAETLEIYTFMEAADESKRSRGRPVSLQDVRQRAEQAAQERLAQYLQE